MSDLCPICGNQLAIDRLEYDDGDLSVCMDCEPCEFRRLYQWGDSYLTVGLRTVSVMVEDSQAVKAKKHRRFKRLVRKARRTFYRQHRRPWVPVSHQRLQAIKSVARWYSADGKELANVPA